MMNKLYIIIALFLAGCCVACSDADKEMFAGDTAGIYFKLKRLKDDASLILRTDTIVYTFAYDDEDVVEREICLPVELMGSFADGARTYHVEIENAAGTVAGEDYEPLAAEQVFPAHKTIDSLRFVWKRNASMQKQTKQVNIKIVGGGDLVPGVQEYLFVSLQVSDILEKPAWWDAWSVGFGTWHPTKLKEWIKIWGKEDLKLNPGNINIMEDPQECVAIIKLKDLFEKEEFLDENGVRLVIPAEF